MNIPSTIPALLCAMALPSCAENTWHELAPLPEKHGFAGVFAGVSNDCLLVAGGANFPDAPLWEGGKKAWSDSVFLLEQPDGKWRVAGKLPGLRGYGVSVTVDEGMLCIGGSDAESHHAECFLLKWENGKLTSTAYPALSQPLAEMTGALVGRTVHLLGGTNKPGATKAESQHLMLDLDALDKGWSQKPFPGPARILAVSAATKDAFFVMSGATLEADANGKPKRSYLHDAWRYDTANGWKELPVMPRATLAAPSPATVSADGQILITGGDDGSLAGFQPISEHPGFPRTILSYDIAAQTWSEKGTIPANLPAPVTTSTTVWKNSTVIPSGEIRPAVRTPRISTISTAP